MIQVPANRSTRLRIEFADWQRKPIDTSTDFEPLDPIIATLPAGLNRVEFASTRGEAEELIEFCLRVNEEEVTRFSSLHSELTGSSYSGSGFDEQRDYAVDAALPTLMLYRPSPGDTYIQMRLVEDDSQ